MGVPVSSTFDAANEYFSGQGVVMIGNRDVNGKPTGLRPLGNCTALMINVATTIITHKGSQDGQRAIDVRLQTETNATMSMTIDSWVAANLAKALRGAATLLAPGSVTAEPVNAYPGLVSGLQYINVSSVVVSKGATALTQYSDELTAWDFKLNPAAGSIMLNDGSKQATANLDTVPTGVVVGTTTQITVTNTAQAGEQVHLFGFTGADAALLNGLTLPVISATGTEVTVAVNTTGKVITAGANTGVVFLSEGLALTVAYNYGAQTLADALTQPLTDNYLRFEGLNTINDNSPVVVEVFKFSNDPLKELALLSDTFGQFEIEGTVLSDPLQTSGSKYFHVKQLY